MFCPELSRDTPAQRNGLRILLGLVLLALLATVVATDELYASPATIKALWFRVAVILGLPIYSYLVLSRPELRPNFKNPLTLAVTVFFLLSLLAALLGVNPGRSFWGTYNRMGGAYQLCHLMLLYFYLVMLTAVNRRFMMAALRLLVWLAGLSGLHGVWQLLNAQKAAGAVFGGRASSVYGNPIFFASFLILPMALALFFCYEARTKTSRTFYAGLFTAILLGVLSSGTRGAVLSLTAVAAGALLVTITRRGSIRRSTILAVAIMGALCITLLIFAADRLLPDSPFRHLAHLSDPARLIEWRAGWKGYQEHPILGVGSENYYVIGNKYFDRELYKYGVDNFDKPHNYALEILATTGIVGFLAYTSIFVLTAVAFWRAKGICRAQSAILICGAAAYHLQNFFAFDMPAAGIAFFVYTAFAASIWPENRQPALGAVQIKSALPPFGMAIVCFIGLASICLVYLTDIATAVTLRNLQHGLTIGVGDARLAKSYLDEAARSRFVFDRVELGNAYRQFAVQAVNGAPQQVEAGFFNSTAEAASTLLDQASRKDGNNPAVWLDQGQLYAMKATINKTSVDPRAYVAIHQAMLLEPQRVEPLYLLAWLYAIDHQPKQAIATAESAVQALPESPEARWQLSEVYWILHQDDLAVQSAEDAMRLGYTFVYVRQLSRLFDYYLEKQDNAKLAELYKVTLKLRPNDFRLYEDLAAAYAKAGFKQGARDAARRAVELNPSIENATREFLETLR